DRLATGASCQAEAVTYTETAAVIALALPQMDPSPELKNRVLTAARQPFVLDARQAAPRRSGVGRRRGWWSGWRISVSGLVAALALVLAVGSLVWALGLKAQLDTQSGQIATLAERAQNYQRVTSVLQAADTQTRMLNGTNSAPEAFGRVYVDPDTGEGMLMVRGLPPLPQGRSYQ